MARLGTIARILGLVLLALEARAEEPLLRPPLVEDVRIEGRRYTPVQTILEVLDVPIGQPLDAQDLWAARRRLMTRGWFHSVDLQLERGSRPGHVVLLVQLRELLPFSAQTNLSELSEGLVSLGVRFQPPGRLGYAVETFLGEEVLGFSAGVDVPNLLNTGTAFSARIYRREREGLFSSSLRVENAAGMSLQELLEETGLSFSRRGLSLEFTRPLLRRWPLTASLGYRLEGLEGENRHGALALGGTNQRLSTISVALTHNSLDGGLFATQGRVLRLRFTLSGDTLGSDYDFRRLVLQAEQVVQPLPRTFLRLSLRGGVVDGFAPFSEHFFAEDLVRGYGSFSAQSRLAPDRGLGGSLELGFEIKPIAGLKRLRLLAFGEAGGLWAPDEEGDRNGTTVVSAGVGFQLMTGFGALSFSLPLWTRDVQPPVQYLQLPPKTQIP